MTCIRRWRRSKLGRPFASIAVRVVDPDDNDVAAGETGEVICRGATVMAGYWNDTQATAKALTDFPLLDVRG